MTTIPSFSRDVLRITCVVGCLALLAACGNAGGPQAATQVAAKVGSEEISLHQVNAVLAGERSSGSTPEQLQVRSRAVLEGLINQQLALEQAEAAELHRSPEILAQVEAARREIVAGAYIRQWAATLPAPDAQEVLTYFQAHPALFAERRQFHLQELVLPRSPEVLAQLERMAVSHAPIEDVAQWLRANKTPFTPGSASRFAEQIPLDVLPRLHALQDGQDAVFPDVKSITFVRLVSSQKAAIAERDALPRIAMALQHQQSTAAIAAQLKALRSQTTVRYEGEFATPLVPELATPVAVTAPPANGERASASTRLEKGVAGLK